MLASEKGSVGVAVFVRKATPAVRVEVRAVAVTYQPKGGQPVVVGWRT